MWQHTISPTPHPAPPALSFDADNRIVGASYDAAGDLTTDPVTGCRFSYDAEQRITAVTGCATASYAYNAQGEREHTVVNGVTREYVSGRAGEARAVFAGQSQLVEGNVYLGGRDLATYAAGTTYFDHADGLGTVRARSNLSGGVVEAYSSLPYGGWLNQVGTVSALHFTGKQFDGETSLTYFPARFQSGYTGRFMTPDWSAHPEAVPYAEVADPQSLNLYSYVLNNPVTWFDPDGHIDCSGKNARGAGCQAIHNWNVQHGISDTAKKSDFPGVPVRLPNGKTVADPHSETGLLMSPTANLNDVATAGKRASKDRTKIGLDFDLGKAVGTGGNFDFQRVGPQRDILTGGFQQLPQFRDVSNFNVGLFAQQAGMSLEQTLKTAGEFASRFSSNYSPGAPYGLSPQTAEFIRAGWEAGASGAFNH